jgi:hypothetical protein
MKFKYENRADVLMNQVTFKLDLERLNLLNSDAGKKGIRLSQLIREIIDKHYKRAKK